MRTFLVLFLVLALAACGTGDPNAAQSDDVPPEENAAFDDIPEHGADEALAAGRDPMSGLPMALHDAIDQARPGWRIVDPREWLARDYLAYLNDGRPAEEQTVYENDIFLQADLNGDGVQDFVAFLINPEGQVVLTALHATAAGYDPVDVQDEGIVDGCCSGAGLQLAPADTYFGIDDEGTEREWVLHSDGFLYVLYEKSARLFTWNDRGEYDAMMVSD